MIFNRPDNSIRLLIEKLGLSLLHGIWLFILALIAISVNYNFITEESQVRSTVTLKKLLLNSPEQLKDFTFIDVSASEVLIPKKGTGGNQIITDRVALDTLFTLISKQAQTQQFILCDLLFEEETTADQSFSASAEKINKLLIPYKSDSTGIIRPFIKHAELGYAGYKVSRGAYAYDHFLKYQYLADPDQKTLPLRMMELANDQQSSSKLGAIWLADSIYLNNVIFDPHIAMSDIRPKIIPLNEIIALLKANHTLFYQKFFDRKFVIIGDFENDLHETIHGEMPGSLIITNLFITINQHDNQIGLGWFLIIWLGFSGLSAVVLFPANWMKNLSHRVKSTYVGPLIIELLSFYSVCWIISAISYCYFHKHIDILLVSIYLTLFRFMKEIIEKRKNRRHAVSPAIP